MEIVKVIDKATLLHSLEATKQTEHLQRFPTQENGVAFFDGNLILERVILHDVPSLYH